MFPLMQCRCLDRQAALCALGAAALSLGTLTLAEIQVPEVLAKTCSLTGKTLQMEIDFEDSSRNKLTTIDSGNVEMLKCFN